MPSLASAGANFGERFFRYCPVAFDGRSGWIGFLPWIQVAPEAMQRR